MRAETSDCRVAAWLASTVKTTGQRTTGNSVPLINGAAILAFLVTPTKRTDGFRHIACRCV